MELCHHPSSQTEWNAIRPRGALVQACFLHAFPAIYATGVAGNLSFEAESLSFFQSELSFFLSDLSFHIAPSFSHKGRVFSGAFTLAVYA